MNQYSLWREVLECSVEENLAHMFRFDVCNTLERHMTSYKTDINKCQMEIKSLINNNKALQDKFSKGMIENLESQSTLALEKPKYMEKWGEH